jgi:arylsulfatase A-like enzyme
MRRIMNRPNIIFYFTDQQRWDTVGVYGQILDITPRLDLLAGEGVLYNNAFTAQPVCGPCRAMFQTGKYPTDIGCFRNNIALPLNEKTIADRLYDVGYETSYVGKWHLASDGAAQNKPTLDFHDSAIPPERRGGYKGFWRASDVLEFTSHGYGGYVWDENMKKHVFEGYRVNEITNYGIEFINNYDSEKPFFMTISHIEPHHQNDHKHYEGPDGSKERFGDYELPKDLKLLGGGNAREEYPDYLGCCKSLDDNLGRVIDLLKKKGIYENTVIIYSSDHGSHFHTRNRDKNKNGFDDYKRSCHSACLRIPMIISGGAFKGGKVVRELVSNCSIPKTIMNIAGVEAQDGMIGEDLAGLINGADSNRKNEIFAQISESRVGRCIRTEDYLYSVCAKDKGGADFQDSDEYIDDFLYDLKNDPYEISNLIEDEAYQHIRDELSAKLLQQIQNAEGKSPVILNSRGF